MVSVKKLLIKRSEVIHHVNSLLNRYTNVKITFLEDDFVEIRAWGVRRNEDIRENN